MPRRREVAKREILPDPVYNSPLVAKFINTMMWDGKKAVAEGILYSALDKIKERTQEDPLKVFKKAIENVSPQSRSQIKPRGRRQLSGADRSRRVTPRGAWRCAGS